MKACHAFLLSAITASAASAAPEPTPVNMPALEKVIVTGTRIGTTTPARLGTAVTIIDRRQIEQRQTVYVSDVLRDVPGAAVSRPGGPGGATQVRMRGAEGNHTLVLMDGAEISDPFQGEFDFAGLVAGDIERIEILHGSQSALYGSDAIGGVINLIPRRGSGPISMSANAEAGSFSTWVAGANVSWGDDTTDIFASATRHVTSGTNLSQFGSERDGARDTSLFINAGIRPTATTQVRGFLRYVDTFAAGDPQDFDFMSPTQGLIVDGNEASTTRLLYGSLRGEMSGLDGAWLTSLTWNHASADRRNYAGGAPSFFTDGGRDRVSLVSSFSAETGTARHTLTGAADWKRETYRNLPIGAPSAINDQRVLETTGVVASYDVTAGAFAGGAAIRHDVNHKFEDATTFRLQGSYRFGDTRLRASAGSGVKNPTNFELFGFDPGSFIGNPGLKAEKSTGWDVGVDQYLLDGTTRLSVTWFSAELDDEIYTRYLPLFVATPDNLATVSQRAGLEVALAGAWQAWELDAAWTWLDATENGQEEVRRPRHSGSVNLTWNFLDEASATLTVRHNGRMTDNEFIFATPADFISLDAYTLVNLGFSWKASDRIEVYGRVENLLDTSYEDVFSYRSPGRAAYAGLRTSW